MFNILKKKKIWFKWHKCIIILYVYRCKVPKYCFHTILIKSIKWIYLKYENWENINLMFICRSAKVLFILLFICDDEQVLTI